ncbi:phosphatase PAP2 family protein [Actinocrinis puniceicyclus]|uniref:Phosphatase PAP2 family protein n=1 Tax=Actinocrinis puniceicyclus TaxID=977794 RepID=A0A8J7WL52_9ACTN|nr:phosphatase PAP2 family protein [Actinocrinis puniceicyclus]MBS2962855.1 phosphatase PAP2 family protein [Actinocrinis puniceicyclus]
MRRIPTTNGPAAPSAETSPLGAPRPAPRWNHDRWWLAPLLLLLGFGLLLWQVKAHGPVTRFDLRLRNGIQDDARDPSLSWMYRPARGMADLGDQTIALSALFVTTAVALRATRSWRPALVAAAALAALATVIPLKLWIDRPGPSRSTLGDAALGFFPSGHTADAVLCYGTSALLLCVFVIPHARVRYRNLLPRAVSAAAAVLVLLTIFGLLWSNFHWLSDTLGSLCWCGAALLILRRVTLSRPLSSRRAAAGEESDDREKIDSRRTESGRRPGSWRALRKRRVRRSGGSPG